MKPLPSRKTTNLSPAVQHNLDMYALAATSAGTGVFEKNLTAVAGLVVGGGMLAMTPAVQARIVYTPAHIHITSMFPLDLNKDGVADFALWNYGRQLPSGTISYFMVAPQFKGNRVIGKIRQNSGCSIASLCYASALRIGANIGAKKQFVGEPDSRFVWMADAFCLTSQGTGCGFEAPWANAGKGVKNRFLGFKFKIKGKTHYGWARLNVVVEKKYRFFDVTLTGYAYETVPNKAIIAGQTTGPDVVTLQPDTAAGSLGRLALGRK
jgi:hypothetical protein